MTLRLQRRKAFTPYGLEINESCKTCKFRSERHFCQTTPPVLDELDSAKSVSNFPARTVLFMQKQEPRGVFIICSGQAKLSISARDGKTMIVRIVNSGEALGLSSVVTSLPYEVTAELLRSSQIAFVERDRFLHLLAQYPEIYQNVSREMISAYRDLCKQLRRVGLKASANEKLAQFLLEWSREGQETKSGIRVALPLTHTEIGEILGHSRETVTRSLAELKSCGLIDLRGSTLIIPSRAALEGIISHKWD